MHTFIVTGTPKLVIDNRSGSIHIHADGDAKNKVTVDVTEHDILAGRNSTIPQIKYDSSTNTITIITQGSGRSFDSSDISMDITTPKTTDVQLNDGSGPLNIEDISGLMNVQTGNGSITVNNISGQSIMMHTGNGSITGDNISGQATLSTGDGSVEVSQGSLNGKSILHSGDGSINYNGSLDSQGNYDFNTGDGSVNVTLPNNASFHMEASTGDGSVNNDFGSNDVGNGPHPMLRLRSGDGSINVYKQ